MDKSESLIIDLQSVLTELETQIEYLKEDCMVLKEERKTDLTEIEIEAFKKAICFTMITTIEIFRDRKK